MANPQETRILKRKASDAPLEGQRARKCPAQFLKNMVTVTAGMGMELHRFIAGPGRDEPGHPEQVDGDHHPLRTDTAAVQQQQQQHGGDLPDHHPLRCDTTAAQHHYPQHSGEQPDVSGTIPASISAGGVGNRRAPGPSQPHNLLLSDEAKKQWQRDRRDECDSLRKMLLMKNHSKDCEKKLMQMTKDRDYWSARCDKAEDVACVKSGCLKLNKALYAKDSKIFELDSKLNEKTDLCEAKEKALEEANNEIAGLHEQVESAHHRCRTNIQEKFRAEERLEELQTSSINAEQRGYNAAVVVKDAEIAEMQRNVETCFNQWVEVKEREKKKAIADAETNFTIKHAYEIDGKDKEIARKDRQLAGLREQVDKQQVAQHQVDTDFAKKQAKEIAELRQELSNAKACQELLDQQVKEEHDKELAVLREQLDQAQIQQKTTSADVAQTHAEVRQEIQNARAEQIALKHDVEKQCAYIISQGQAQAAKDRARHERLQKEMQEQHAEQVGELNRQLEDTRTALEAVQQDVANKQHQVEELREGWQNTLDMNQALLGTPYDPSRIPSAMQDQIGLADCACGVCNDKCWNCRGPISLDQPNPNHNGLACFQCGAQCQACDVSGNAAHPEQMPQDPPQQSQPLFPQQANAFDNAGQQLAATQFDHAAIAPQIDPALPQPYHQIATQQMQLTYNDFVHQDNSNAHLEYATPNGLSNDIPIEDHIMNETPADEADVNPPLPMGADSNTTPIATASAFPDYPSNAMPLPDGAMESVQAPDATALNPSFANFGDNPIIENFGSPSSPFNFTASESMRAAQTAGAPVGPPSAEEGDRILGLHIEGEIQQQTRRVNRGRQIGRQQQRVNRIMQQSNQSRVSSGPSAKHTSQASSSASSQAAPPKVDTTLQAPGASPNGETLSKKEGKKPANDNGSAAQSTTTASPSNPSGNGTLRHTQGGLHPAAPAENTKSVEQIRRYQPSGLRQQQNASDIDSDEDAEHESDAEEAENANNANHMNDDSDDSLSERSDSEFPLEEQGEIATNSFY